MVIILLFYFILYQESLNSYTTSVISHFLARILVKLIQFLYDQVLYIIQPLILLFVVPVNLNKDFDQFVLPISVFTIIVWQHFVQLRFQQALSYNYPLLIISTKMLFHSGLQLWASCCSTLSSLVWFLTNNSDKLLRTAILHCQ